MVEVVFVAPRPHHAIYAGAATDGLAHGLGDGAAIDARAAFSAECPVELAALVEEPGLSDEDARLQVIAARFQQAADAVDGGDARSRRHAVDVHGAGAAS